MMVEILGIYLPVNVQALLIGNGRIITEKLNGDYRE
jgi:hypothetical protein